MPESTMRLTCSLVVVKHPEKGDAQNGKEICDLIQKMVSGDDSPLCIFHDATGMDTANPAYASEFKILDKALAGRVGEVVCAIPGSIPRMLAHTVAMFSEKDWQIFKALPDALFYLSTKGFRITEKEVSEAAEVSIWKAGP